MYRVVSLVLLVCGVGAGPWLDNILEQDLKKTDETGVHWALLVAGSNGWYNYRHQADVCHAYQILKKHGIPDERIVVMMYDDIAHNEQNPTPGIVINRPDGKDVYHGVPKDYTGDDVTPENFLKILQGKDMTGTGSGKTIKSGPNSHVFVNFVDHGAPGIVAFPEGLLHATDLNDAIKSMYQKTQYNQMVFYIEACESGSMFQDLLPKDIYVFATTASTANESSYACYYDAKRQTYLGDVYSVKWMEDSDQEDLKKESLEKQFKIVVKETNTSHPQQYGQMDISDESVSNFQSSASHVHTPSPKLPPIPLNAVPAPDVPLAILHHRLRAATNMKEQDAIMKQIDELLRERERMTHVMKRVVGLATRDGYQADRVLGQRRRLTSHYCYKAAVDAFHKQCFNLNKHEYALRTLYALVNLCEEPVPRRTILEAISKACPARN